MSKFTLIAGALFVIPAPAISQIVFDDVPLQVQPSSASAMKSDWDKVECRAENALGSRLQKDKVCLTKWLWWTYEQETKQWIQSMERLGQASIAVRPSLRAAAALGSFANRALAAGAGGRPHLWQQGV